MIFPEKQEQTDTFTQEQPGTPAAKNSQTSKEKQTHFAQKPENSSEYQQLTKYLPRIDVKAGVENCGGAVSDYIDILKLTYDCGAKQLEELEVLRNTENYNDYIIKIHAMKATTLNIGALSLSALAKEQEKQGKNGNYQYIVDHFSFQEIIRILDEEKQHSYSEETMEIFSTIENYIGDFSVDELKEFLQNYL